MNTRMPTNNGRLARIVDFLCARFLPLRTASGSLEVRSLRKFLRVRAVLLLYSAVIPSPSLARAQPQLAAAFRFFADARADGAVLPVADLSRCIARVCVPLLEASYLIGFP
jgi:hypothetical protein